MGEGSDGFHTSIHLFQTPCNALQIPFKIISFLLKKDGQKNNRDFIKGGRRGSPFYEVTSQFFFFTNDDFPSFTLQGAQAQSILLCNNCMCICMKHLYIGNFNCDSDFSRSFIIFFPFYDSS